MEDIRGSEAGLRRLELKENYVTSSESLVDDFLVPAISSAVRYSRCAGYFSSAFFALVPIAFTSFVERGGKMRLLCSPFLSAVDVEALAADPGTAPPAIDIALASLKSLTAGSADEQLTARLLRALLDAEVLEIRFATVGHAGLFHDKVGVLEDSVGDAVSFIGSANETAAAWSGFQNHEQIETFQTWQSDEAARRVRRHQDTFEETWLGLRRGVKVTSAEAAAAVVRLATTDERLSDVLNEVRRSRRRVSSNPSGGISLRGYQEAALASWEAQGRRGIIEFATGGGKTRTAIEAIRRWIQDGRPAIVQVPSELLHSQWRAEISVLLPGVSLLTAGAGSSNVKWKSLLHDYTAPDVSLGQRVVLTTYQTSASEDFLKRVQDGDHLLVVGDEVHFAGAPSLRRFMQDVTPGASMGLSATPERYGDPVGTAAIFEWYGPSVQPTFSLSDALTAGVLVPYTYHVHECTLLDEEQDRWDKFSRSIAQEMGREGGEISERALHLMRQRAQILKSASEKASLSHAILSEDYSRGDRWLIYCSSTAHIAAVREEIRHIDVPILEYHSANSSNHEAVMDYFISRGGILLAIKCLDEGIDIPRINKAILLASSTNPREYIQRRGRVLRRSPGKFHAVLHDVLVMGRDGAPLTRSEAVRGLEIARDAENSSAELVLREILARNGNAAFDYEEEQND